MAAIPEKTIADVVTDFLSTAPTLEAIAQYRLPDDFQERAHTLLDKLRAGNLSSDEQAEMAEFRQIDHLLTLIKAKTRQKLKAQL